MARLSTLVGVQGLNWLVSRLKEFCGVKRHNTNILAPIVVRLGFEQGEL
ncbi:hypothetical protein O9993_18670 [Vibrio lentus]|nr:hypothetical protein [Vibrio lentus]